MTFEAAQFTRVLGQDCGPEVAVLRRVLARETGDAEPPQSGTAPVDPTRLFELARLNKVSLFLLRQRDAIPESCAPILGWLDRLRLQSWVLNRQSLALASEIDALLQAEGIEHLHFKGPLQQLVLYGDPVAKPAGDVDLLVRPRDRLRADACLRAAGLQPMGAEMAAWWSTFLGEQHYQRAPGAPVADLHHRLQQPGSPSPRNAYAMIDRARSQSFEGRDYAVPLTRDICLIAAISVVKALFGHEPCGGYVVDLRAALGKLTAEDLDLLRAEARRQGLAETLELGCHAVEALFGLPSGRWSSGANPLRQVQSDLLLRLVLTPWEPDLPRPRRREVLWALCGRSPLRFGAEAGRAGGSEVFRRLLSLRIAATARKEKQK